MKRKTPGNSVKNWIYQTLAEQQSPLFAILDGARSDEIIDTLHAEASAAFSAGSSVSRYQSIYDGKTACDIGDSGPILVEIPKKSDLLWQLVDLGWGNAWGYYFTSKTTFEAIRFHFKHFVFVTLPDGAKVYFRFYDPRVIRGLLPCDSEASRQFREPFEWLFIETRDRNLIIGPPTGLPRFYTDI